jgi:hypothetical protein
MRQITAKISNNQKYAYVIRIFWTQIDRYCGILYGGISSEAFNLPETARRKNSGMAIASKTNQHVGPTAWQTSTIRIGQIKASGKAHHAG